MSIPEYRRPTRWTPYKDGIIQSFCPACRSKNTVFIGSGGYLTCSWINCPEPDFMQAWENELEVVRQKTEHVYLKELKYWRNLAEQLMKIPALRTEPTPLLLAEDQVITADKPPTEATTDTSSTLKEES